MKPNLLFNTKCKACAIATVMLAAVASSALAADNERIEPNTGGGI